MKPGCNVATLIERYFTDRLMRQRNVTANTIASYRDTFRLLFTFAQAKLRKPPSALTLDELDAPFIGAFLSFRFDNQSPIPNQFATHIPVSTAGTGGTDGYFALDRTRTANHCICHRAGLWNGLKFADSSTDAALHTTIGDFNDRFRS